MLLVSGILLFAYMVACADRRRRSRRLRLRMIERLRDQAPHNSRYIDLSNFNQDQLLRNRSERWDA
jgi:hypothetical protein